MPTDFFHAVASYGFLQNAVLAGLLASLACGVIGTYVVVKRIAFISGGIAHAVLGGMGIAYFFGGRPLLGAIPAALLSAVIIGWVSLRAREREDTIIGALWAVGMAVGIMFIYKTPGYSADLFSYLFGNILMVSAENVWLVGVLDAVIILLVVMFFKGFTAVCFDEEFARVQGLNVDVLYIFLLCLVALTVVILVQVVGIVMVIALLTLPAAIAGQWLRGLRHMMIGACAAGMLFTQSGLAVSYTYDLPAGATIVLIAGVTFLGSTIFKTLAERGH
ncbi:MAG: metal ABC transporter permease [Candidatus Pacebacteria bacterium]|nr:metal ABC transporter permease [Candidatus Paceibacterota bacterium]